MLIGQDNYRMQFGMSFHSTVFTGFRSFENIDFRSSSGYSGVSFYEIEKYDINYQNFGSSAGINLKWGLNWVNNRNYIIRQNVSYFLDYFRERIDYTLVNFENKDSTYQPSKYFSNTPYIGETRRAKMDGFTFGFTNELILLKKLSKKWNIGGGISWNWINRSDRSFDNMYDGNGQQIYAPNFARLVNGTYVTTQIGLVFHAEKQLRRWNWFVTANQMIFTTKKAKNKGAYYFPETIKLWPISHNLDYRFPAIINFGAAIPFDKIKSATCYEVE